MNETTPNPPPPPPMGGTIGLDQGDGSTRVIPPPPDAALPQRLDTEAATKDGCSRCGFMSLVGRDCPEAPQPFPEKVEEALEFLDLALIGEPVRSYIAALTAQNAALVAERDALRGEVEEYRAALVDAWKNDATRYDYGDRRRGDDAPAPAGQRWQTPREIVADFLRSKGRDIWNEIARLQAQGEAGE